MDFFARMLSGNRAQEADEIKQAFKENMESLTKLVGDRRLEVYALLDMLYDSSYPERQIFLKTPSQARLNSNEELVLSLLFGLDSMGFPVAAQMLVFVQKHGIDAIQECLLTLLQLLSPLLHSKKAPEFTTDDIVDAMDFEWHSTSRTGSPLLNVIASVTSSSPGRALPFSPRTGSPLLNVIASVTSRRPGRASAASGLTKSSPFRRAISERSSRSHELDAKSALDKSVVAAQPALTSSASSRISEIIPELAPTSEIEPTEKEATALYSLNTLPSDQHQHRERRHSSSLRRLFAEDTELGEEGSVGASKRNSSSRPRTSSDTRFSFASYETSPLNSLSEQLTGREIGVNEQLPPGDDASSAEDRKLHLSRRRAAASSLPSNEAALWRQDSEGFTVDVSENHFPEEDLKAKVETKDEFTAKSRESNALNSQDRASLNSFTHQCHHRDIIPGLDVSAAHEDGLVAELDERPLAGQLEEEEKHEQSSGVAFRDIDASGGESGLLHNEGMSSAKRTHIEKSENELVATPLPAEEMQTTLKADEDREVVAHELEQCCTSQEEQKNTEYRCDRDIDEQDTMGMGGDVLMSPMHHMEDHPKLPFDVESGHLTMSADTGITSYAKNELSFTGDQCAAHGDDHMQWEGLDVEHQICDGVIKGNALGYCSLDASSKDNIVDPNATNHIPPVTESCPVPLEMPLEENLWSKEGQVLQEGLESMNPSPQSLHETNIDLHVVDSPLNALTSLSTLPSAHSDSHSSEEGTQLVTREISEREGNSGGQLQLPKLQVDTVSRQLSEPHQPEFNQGLEESLKSSNDQFEQLISELDAAERNELETQMPLNSQNDAERENRGCKNDVKEAKLVEDMVRCPDDEGRRTDDSEKGFVERAGQFIMGGANMSMQDSSDPQESNFNIRDMESNLEVLQNSEGFDFLCDDNGAGEALSTNLGPLEGPPASIENEELKDSLHVRVNSRDEQAEKEDEGVQKNLMVEEGRNQPVLKESEAVNAGSFLALLHPGLDQPLINAKDDPYNTPTALKKDQSNGRFPHEPLQIPSIQIPSDKVDVDCMANLDVHGQPTSPRDVDRQSTTRLFDQPSSDIHSSLVDRWVDVDATDDGARSRKKPARSLFENVCRCFCCSKPHTQP